MGSDSLRQPGLELGYHVVQVAAVYLAEQLAFEPCRRIHAQGASLVVADSARLVPILVYQCGEFFYAVVHVLTRFTNRLSVGGVEWSPLGQCQQFAAGAASAPDFTSDDQDEPFAAGIAVAVAGAPDVALNTGS